ncbi:MAG: DUF2793 domain-containing protein [Pseudomonadota bacterium]
MPDLKSPILSLPYIAAAQAQKHVTHNEALAQLDILVQLSVVAFDAVTPPSDPAGGDVYAIGAAATGVWAGQAVGTLAAFTEGTWFFAVPKTGWIAGDGASASARVWDGSAWQSLGAGMDASVDMLGVNATADLANRISVSAEATLLSHEGAGHQLKLNKAADTDTASLLFQTGWSGRAEMGTTGSDDFEIKVSADGATWFAALTCDGTSGAVSVSALDMSGPARFASYTVATLPSPDVGAVVFVSDASGGAVMAFGDGTNWRRMTNRSVVS